MIKSKNTMSIIELKKKLEQVSKLESGIDYSLSHGALYNDVLFANALLILLERTETNE